LLMLPIEYISSSVRQAGYTSNCLLTFPLTSDDYLFTLD
jgi:hypothetical protein